MRRAARRFAPRLGVALLASAVAAIAWGGALASAEIAAAVAAHPSAHREWIAAIYAPADAGAVWFTADGARSDVAVALQELRAADRHGLAASDYDVDRLQDDVEAALRPDPPLAAVARADVALTAAVLRFVADLRFGRVRAQDVEPHFRVASKPASFVAALREAVARGRLAALVADAEPAFPLYARLEKLLAQYRMLALEPLVPLPPLPAGETKVEPGDRYAGVPALRELLVRLGDLPPEAEAPAGEHYSGVLAAAVARFQERHELAPDGVIGRQTLAALGVRPEARVRQIELSLERLRWLPDLPRGPLLAINVPSFRLWAFADPHAVDRAQLSMPVIVGRAFRGETPMFVATMRSVEFSPYWNVPPRILRNELLPRLARDPALLAKDDMELVETAGAGSATTVVDATALARLAAGELRLRQRPGPKNALGGVKFVLPNAMDVYLHATPAQELFARTRRDFSHGCIRVRDPAALAQFVLRDRPEWTPAAIDAAMTSGTNRVVPLAAPIPVVIFYTTAIVDAGGNARFLPDVYAHDRKLEAALRNARATAR